MRNTVLVLLVLTVAAGAWLYLGQEPELVIGDPELAESAEAPPMATIDRPAAGATAGSPDDLPVSPLESSGDRELDAQRVARADRLEEIRAEAERRRRLEGDDTLEEDRGVSRVGSGGGGGSRGGAGLEETFVSEELEVIDEGEEPEPDVGALISLETEAARRAAELELVSPDSLDGLSDAEQRVVLADEWVWHTFLVEKFGPDYTLSQQNQASVARGAFEKATPQERLERLRNAI